MPAFRSNAIAPKRTNIAQKPLNLADPSQQVSIDRKEVKSMELSTVSPMPPMLLSMLSQEEILDLVAYVLSGGDKENAWFKK